MFFFDEAHLLFTGASKDFLTQVTQTVRLVRSKGVGVFFVTQSPKDVPADVLAQLGAGAAEEAAKAQAKADADAAKERARAAKKEQAELEKMRERLLRDAAKQGAGTTSRSRSSASPLDSILKTAGTTLVREITRSIFGTRRR